QQGTLTLTLDQVAVDRETAKAGGFPAPGAYVCLSVADTGVGIPSAVQPQVVEPFFTTKPIGNGTGLGLSMVYGFARQSGGHLTLDSTEGAGTTVNLFFPVATGAMPPE
ncbi:MAG: hybrid sensor histidine kinase/response regulator, partial [Gammaproteobacteria bacterium]|nr:hybrid sensor histidine kinase/response regulator [Gammaproteobacteria bacterium]NIR98253.1 hybrid sensor histidine kinase/response regulator [Gammaproteobacteria bacterium]NIT63930.1 hybrid sensor histidine kinase/response regulator [Gammaproteobacteria bacterium]NIV20928.1 hybrid sensor histidine kinase/response regulator [Gammaproteobacteria bacterium]NIX10221.1 hybrid sensor histidine kinase/response regulator [Gammaproteobacteria bacterium]